MPNLLDRINQFARRNLHDAPPPAPVKKKPERSKPAPAPSVPPAAGDERSRFLAFIRASVGGRYCSPPKPALYSKPRCTDCSGNVAWAYYQATGREIPGDGGSHEQYKLAGRFLKPARGGASGEAWEPGDLLFYDTMGVSRSGNRASHVAVYIGGGQAVSAMNDDAGIMAHGTASAYWNQRFLAAKRLWEIASEQPETPPSGGASPVTPGAAPLPAAAVPVGFGTAFRAIPGIGGERWRDILIDAGSPMASEAVTISAECGPLLTVAGAQSFKESQYGKAATGNNPLGLMELDGSTLMTFPSWTAAFREWWRRITDSNYKRGVYLPREMTLEQFIVTYVGGPGCWSSRGGECGNGETWTPNGGPNSGSVNLYLYQTKARINRYLGHYDPDPLWPDFQPAPGGGGAVPGGYTAHRIEGSNQRLYLPADIEFNVLLTPVTRSCNRSGRALQLQGIRQHETGNTRPGTGARMHAEWQFNGTQGHPDGCIAVHFYVDDHSVYQTLPINEQGIHSGDDGNRTQIAIEAAVNSDGNWQRTYRNTVALEAALHHIAGFSPAKHMWMHHEASGCPPNLRRVWNQFEIDVQRGINQILSAS